jgi:hypothetical protein
VDLKRGGILFAYQVSDSERYGVIEFDKEYHVTNIVESLSTLKRTLLFLSSTFMTIGSVRLLQR